MKLTLYFFILIFSSKIGCAQIDTLLVKQMNNHYYSISKLENKKLLIHLHGGINNPYFKTDTIASLNYLLEGNSNFIANATKNEFDVLLPITNDSLDWLNNSKYCFKTFKKYITSLSKTYSEIWISGFSDGGTGSYKLFYTYPNYFSGLLIFNGYPYHNYFQKNVDYTTVSNKTILFCSTKKDKRIPYEFLLTEYSKQKQNNPNTFLYLTEGKHDFKAYKNTDFELIFKLILNIDNKETEALHGLILNDKLIEFYKFRKSIVRKYGIGKADYIENKEQKIRINNTQFLTTEE
jgi:predicted esterase